ncbi:hypothetical protein H4R20_006337 [Coemansia guatemalensis]|uniref:Uncharacterized protein n=1 Tax=Coemansia guatemalensis TaxID=2761395 RepID=A0A9W8HTY3_9FUNG|nr:hypothetical protein H4R20_006337 [Coemansia guatemalensis]
MSQSLPPFPASGSKPAGGWHEKQASHTPSTVTMHSTGGSSGHTVAWPSSNSKQGVPQPPSMAYNLQHQTQQNSPQLTNSPSDYRRLPSLPPRVRSTAASSFLDRSSTHSNSTPTADRSRPF